MARPPSRQLLNYLADYDRPVADLALALREIVVEEAPEAVEKVYRTHALSMWFHAGSRTMKDSICYVSVATRHVNLGFYHGAALADPNQVLEGDGKTMRHIKFRSELDLERPFVRRYIQAAMEQVGQAGAVEGKRAPGARKTKGASSR